MQDEISQGIMAQVSKYCDSSAKAFRRTIFNPLAAQLLNHFVTSSLSTFTPELKGFLKQIPLRPAVLQKL